MDKVTYSKGASTKKKILDAAKKALLKEGIGSLTIDMLCHKARISKGAFFHHFKSRDDLLLNLLKSLTAHQTELYHSLEKADAQPFGKGLRAYMIATLSKATAEEEENAKAVCRCLMEMIFTKLSLLKKAGLVPGYYEPLLSNEMLGGMSKEQGLLLLLACEGLWYDQSLGMQGLTKEQADLAIDLLIGLTRKHLI